MAYKYKYAAVGGTFDLLHRGHKALLDKSFEKAKIVSLGVNSDKFCSANSKKPFQDQSQRLRAVKNYLKSKNFLKRAKFHIHDDQTCPVPKDKNIDVIVATSDTSDGVRNLNKQRAKNNLEKLTFIKVPILLASDKKPISATRIKLGEISTDGHLYKNMLYKISGKHLSEKIRSKLKNPFGKIVNIDSKLKNQNIIAVGDISVKNLLALKILPKVSVVDFYVERKLTFTSLTQLGFAMANADVIIKNEAGQISKGLVDQIAKALGSNHSSIILVDGEEDLAAVPAVLLAPIGTTVVYGQPQKGAVIITVNTEIKDKLCKILGL